MTEKRRHALFSFAVVGTLGFALDVAVLYVLKGVLGLYWARLVSFLCAAIVTWVLNRRFTFAGRASGLGLWREGVSYLGLMGVGALVNYGVYAAGIGFSSFLAKLPALAVALGSLAGLAVNYLQASRLLFRRPGLEKGRN